MPRICVVGSSNIDLTLQTPRLPRPGETLSGTGFLLGFGGKGANQAVMAARLGAEVVFLSCVGADVFGGQLLDHYRSEGIDTTFVRTVAGVPTGTAGILVDADARNCIIVVPGANAVLNPDDIERAASVLASVDVLLCQLETPLDATNRALVLARQAGVRTILNPAPALSLSDEILGLADLCAPNETEAEILTGLSVTTPEQAEQAARALLARGPRAVVLTRGDQGVLLADEAGCRHLPAVAVPAVDSTGAGDAFLGALAVFLADGLDLETAARRACAVAALSVTRVGAQASFPGRVEVETFLAEHAP